LLIVDPTLSEDIDRDTVDKIAIVKKELSWISSKESLSTAKLKKKFLDPVKTERIEVFAIEKDSCVATFRTPVLDFQTDFRSQTAATDKAATSLFAQSVNDKERKALRRDTLTKSVLGSKEQKKHNRVF
jgi:hypothetical protein